MQTQTLLSKGIHPVLRQAKSSHQPKPRCPNSTTNQLYGACRESVAYSMWEYAANKSLDKYLSINTTSLIKWFLITALLPVMDIPENDFGAANSGIRLDKGIGYDNLYR